MNRWWVVLGGVSMNLALGSLYAWSVFVLPLEEEFGWTRAETSWVFSIAIVSFASSFVLAGRLQDRRGPRIPATIGAVLVGLGNGFGYATPMPVEMVSRQARPRRRSHGGRVRRGLGDLRAGGQFPDRAGGAGR